MACFYAVLRESLYDVKYTYIIPRRARRIERETWDITVREAETKHTKLVDDRWFEMFNQIIYILYDHKVK